MFRKHPDRAPGFFPQPQVEAIDADAIFAGSDMAPLDPALQRRIAQLERASRAKDRLLAGLSHELRTPLNAIVGYSGALLMQLPGELNTEQARQLSTIQNNATRLLSLVNDLIERADHAIDCGDRARLHIAFKPARAAARARELTLSIDRS